MKLRLLTVSGLLRSFAAFCSSCLAASGLYVSDPNGFAFAGPFSNSQVRVFNYTLLVPPGQSGAAQFTGVLTPSAGSATPITGDQQLEAAQNGDWLVSLNAIMASGGQLQFTNDGIISLTNTFEVTHDVVLDGAGHSVTLSGNN
jgi:hypothetical protein